MFFSISHALLQILVQVFASAVDLGSVPYMPGAVVFLADLLQGFHSCTVIVKKAVDALITSQWVECLGNIGDRVQHHVILPVEIGVLRTAFKPQGKKGKVVHKSLKT